MSMFKLFITYSSFIIIWLGSIILDIVSNYSCHSLTYLSVCFCEHISEAGIELLGQTHSLTSIDISGCNCGDGGLSSLGNNSRLRDVTLSECANITDLGLQKFAQQCKNIERLDLSHCMVRLNIS